MKRNLVRLLPVSLFTATVALSVNTAQGLEPANLQAGPVFFTPTLDTRLAYVDNLYRSASDTFDTGILTIAPRIQAWMVNGPSQYSFTWKLKDYTYFASHADDFTDNTFKLDIHQEFNAKNVLNVFGDYYIGHEARGTGLTDGIGQLVDKPVEVNVGTLGGDYTYGSKAAKGRITLTGLARQRDYQNFEEVTQYRNYDQFLYGGTFFWRVGAQTDVLFEVRYTDTEYDLTNPQDPNGSLDSGEISYFAGFAMDATAKVSGSARVGMYERSYDSGVRGDADGFSWEVDLTYKPRTYSRFTLKSVRSTKETNGLGNAVNTTMTTLSWDHNWGARSSTLLSFGAGQEDYTDSVPTRKDDSYRARASYNYAFRRWLDFGAGYRYVDRTSDLELFNYSRNEVFVDVNLSF